MARHQRLSTNLTTTQTIAMTPELRQSIGLLRLSSADVREFVAEEIEKNPFLETESSNPPQSAAATTEAATGNEASTKVAATTQATEAPYKADFAPGSGSQATGADRLSAVEFAQDTGSLRTSLLQQIRLSASSPGLLRIAERLVEELEDDGYLRVPIDDIAEDISASRAAVLDALKIVQRCEPSGVGARSLVECFALQLADKGRLTELSGAVLGRLETFARHGSSVLAKQLAVPEDAIDEIVAEIRTLEPDPGAKFRQSSVEFVVPDINVVRNNLGGWHVELLPEALPRVIVNQTYAAEVSAAGEAAATYVTQHTRRANWLIRSLEQRASTILKVASEIVRVQEGFFSAGPRHLKPLTLKVVADALGMHESTVSRVTRGKFLICERGTFELKYFFSKAIPTTDGFGTISALSIQERIRAIIADEPRKTPFSDDRIAQMLKKDGVNIARRTVSKYREFLGIPSSFLRRRKAERQGR